MSSGHRTLGGFTHQSSYHVEELTCVAGEFRDLVLVKRRFLRLKKSVERLMLGPEYLKMDRKADSSLYPFSLSSGFPHKSHLVVNPWRAWAYPHSSCQERRM